LLLGLKTIGIHGDKPSPVFKFTFYYENKINSGRTETRKKTGFIENKKQVNSKGITVRIQKDNKNVDI
jgi:hypothetical protein